MAFEATHVLASLSVQLNPVPLPPGTQLLPYSNTREFGFFSRGGGVLLSSLGSSLFNPSNQYLKLEKGFVCLGDTDKIQSLHS